MNKFVYSSLFCVFLIFKSSFSNADLASALNDAFDGAVLSSSPGQYQIGGRTVYSGGYIRTRIPMAAPPVPFTIQGPGFSGGCNGIDIYGGSFSYISADEIISWLEKVMANTGALAAYTFMTYLKDACSVCSDTMDTLYAMQDLMKNTMMDSCSSRWRFFKLGCL